MWLTAERKEDSGREVVVLHAGVVSVRGRERDAAHFEVGPSIASGFRQKQSSIEDCRFSNLLSISQLLSSYYLNCYRFKHQFEILILYE